MALPTSTRTQVTKRFCPVCMKTRKFKFNPKIGHSNCADCQASFGKESKETFQKAEKYVKPFKSKVEVKIEEIVPTIKPKGESK